MINTVIQGDNREVLKTFPDGCIDLTVTSPPYDNLRTYNNSLEWSFEIFQDIAKELYRVTKDGGVVVWVVGDATVNGSETGTSFRQALYFKEIGFNLHDTMIYNRSGKFPESTRYWQDFEFMFVLTKDGKPTFNPLKEKSVREAGERVLAKKRSKYGELIEDTCHKKNTFFTGEKNKSNIWYIPAGWMSSSKDKIAYEHPAIFPEKLAIDHILSWSNENETVLDPFAGSGTTAIACIKTNRNYICIEKEPKYVDIINKRIENELSQMKLAI